MCCLCIQFTNENTSERTILHQVNKKNSGGEGGGGQIPPEPPPPPPPFQVWLLALQKRLATPLTVHGHKYSSPLIFYYIFHIKPHFFQKNILKLLLGRFL